MTENLKLERGSGNVFLDVGFPPDEAQNLSLRSELMSWIEGGKVVPIHRAKGA